tara:strand:- start:582 stop:1241 length:660 start_codon:yes stop_codon:yes gene_type:complete
MPKREKIFVIKKLKLNSARRILRKQLQRLMLCRCGRLLLLALCLLQCAWVNGLAWSRSLPLHPRVHLQMTSAGGVGGPTPPGPNDEIAELEARLAELKAAESSESLVEAASDPSSIANAASQPKGFDGTTLSYRGKVANVKGPAPSELLSESWKEDEGSSEGGGSLVPVLGTLVALVALVAFSQVPIGTVETFNDGRSASVESPAEIRARYAAAGYEAE